MTRMPFRWRLAAVIALGALATGNACAQRRPIAASDTTAPYETSWVTVAPRGSWWYVFERSSSIATFAKNLSSKQHFFRAVA